MGEKDYVYGTFGYTFSFIYLAVTAESDLNHSSLPTNGNLLLPARNI